MVQYISRKDIKSHTANLFLEDSCFDLINSRKLSVEEKLILIQARSIDARRQAFEKIEKSFNVSIKSIDFSDCISFVVEGDCDWMPLLDAFKDINKDITLGRLHNNMQTFMYETQRVF